MAVTEQVASLEADSTFPDTEQPVPDAAKVTAPVPEPPVVVRVIGVPTGLVRMVFDTTRVAWATGVIVKVTEVEAAE